MAVKGRSSGGCCAPEDAAASVAAGEEVRENLRMVENEGRERVPGENTRLGGVVAAGGHAVGVRKKDRADRMPPGVARGVGVAVELAGQAHGQARLLAGLAHRRRLQRLAGVDEAARERPAERRVLAL